MKRILQVVSCLELGGTEAFIMNNYRALDRNEYQFDFVVFAKKDYPYLPEIEEKGGRVFFASLPGLRNILEFLRQVRRIIRENGPFLAIHSHVNIANGWVMLAAATAQVPIRVSHSHAISRKEGGGLTILYRSFEELLIKRFATRILACSENAGDSLYGHAYFSKHGKIIHNGINLESFIQVTAEQSDSIHRELAVPRNGSLVMGNVTRFDKNKNPLFAMEVFRNIVAVVPDAILIMGGPDAGLLDDTQRRVHELGLERNVRFIGRRTDIPICLQLIDMYLLPSIHEGFSYVLLEAQASGCECFASDGVPYEVDLGIGTMHFLSLNDSPILWADRIIKCYQSRMKPTEDRIRQAFADAGFEIETTLQELIDIYDEKS